MKREINFLATVFGLGAWFIILVGNAAELSDLHFFSDSAFLWSIPVAVIGSLAAYPASGIALRAKLLIIAIFIAEASLVIGNLGESFSEEVIFVAIVPAILLGAAILGIHRHLNRRAKPLTKQ